MRAANTQSQELRAKDQEPSFSHTTATYLMAVAMYCSEMRPFHTHSSPLEAAEAGTQTVGHSPQGCWPFRVAPPMPLSVSNYVSFPKPALTVDPTVARRFAGLQLMRIIGETCSPVKKIQQK
jgi:hypothetical protein